MTPDVLMKSVVVLAVALAACRRADIPVETASQLSATRLPIAQFVAAGRTPPAFARLAHELEPARVSGDPRAAVDAEVRLLALAVPLADSLRARPLDVQLASLALTVWPTLIGEATRPDETPAAYVERLCTTSLASYCRDVPERHRAVAVRAVAMQRANERMHDALERCGECRGEPEWQRLGWHWESLDRDAARTLHEVSRSDDTRPSA